MSSDVNNLSDAQVEGLLQQPESKDLEFKAELTDPGQAAQLVAAMANSGGGRIVLGAAEGAEPVGLDDPEQTRRMVEKAVQAVEPRVPLAFDEIAVDGRPIVVASLQPGKDQGPFLPPDGAIVRRVDRGRNAPLVGPELVHALSQAEPKITDRELRLEAAIEELHRRVVKLDGRTHKGFKEAKMERRWQSQLKGWVISGFIGAVIGVAASMLAGL